MSVPAAESTSTSEMKSPSTLGIAIVGHDFMGRIHAHAWQTASKFFDLDRTPVIVAVSGRNAEKTQAFADRFGIPSIETDWRALLERDDVDVLDLCVPGNLHAEIAMAALAAGKHVLCEKPLANTVAEAEAMVAVAERAEADGVFSMVGFSYRRTPALAYARDLITSGRLGELRHIRAVYLQDWITDPEFPLVWRLQKDLAGSGALGDIGAHIIDLAHFLTGQRVTGVSAVTETFVKTRPLQASGDTGTGLSAVASEQRGDVTVDDAAMVLARTDGGALATFEATRFATGRKNAMRIEVNGTLGTVSFDFERMNELEFLDATLPDTENGFRRILVTEAEHPYVGAWWPAGHGLGYEHTFIHQAKDFAEDIAAGRAPSPSFRDGLGVQLILDAIERSAADSSRWTPIG